MQWSCFTDEGKSLEQLSSDSCKGLRAPESACCCRAKGQIQKSNLHTRNFRSLSQLATLSYPGFSESHLAST
ncbi:hypothetical protein CEXT_68771 [Caerostris extrusa]|uniref:Uncharacterized protein n=1 Tax=Caerostris extrusa TaxID=172846 RepID=A0AAV4XRR1_CAEEX|nr:hypothetical protein CEXT_68771 [Caerostris extrusa]